MSATDILRRAATLMRERAGEALCDGGSAIPWRVSDMAGCECCQEVRDGGGDLIGYVDDRQSPHIASWHPGVAKAVAAWLDAEASAFEVYEAASADEALAVARAYLGEAVSDD